MIKFTTMKFGCVFILEIHDCLFLTILTWNISTKWFNYNYSAFWSQREIRIKLAITRIKFQTKNSNLILFRCFTMGCIYFIISSLWWWWSIYLTFYFVDSIEKQNIILIVSLSMILHGGSLFFTLCVINYY